MVQQKGYKNVTIIAMRTHSSVTAKPKIMHSWVRVIGESLHESRPLAEAGRTKTPAQATATGKSGSSNRLITEVAAMASTELHASHPSTSVVSRKRFVTALPLFVEVVVTTAVLPSTPTCHLLQLSSSRSSWKCPLVKGTGPTRSATSMIFHGSHHTLRGTIR